MPFVLDGLQWQLGNGLTIKFWRDRWLDNSPLTESCSQDVIASDVDSIVVDYWIEDVG